MRKCVHFNFFFQGMEEKILKEVALTIQHINNLISTKKETIIAGAHNFLEVPNLNVIWGLVAAIRYDFEDTEPKRQFDYLRTFLGEKLAGPISFIPWLRYLYPFSTIFNDIVKAMDAFRVLLKNIIEDQR